MDQRIIFFNNNESMHKEKMNFSNTKLRDLPLTMVYAPMQPFSDLYEDENALMRGTLYSDLDKPFKAYKMR